MQMEENSEDNYRGITNLFRRVDACLLIPFALQIYELCVRMYLYIYIYSDRQTWSTPEELYEISHIFYK